MPGPGVQETTLRLRSGSIIIRFFPLGGPSVDKQLARTTYDSTAFGNTLGVVMGIRLLVVFLSALYGSGEVAPVSSSSW
jgi:hypothetical protein